MATRTVVLLFVAFGLPKSVWAQQVPPALISCWALGEDRHVLSARKVFQPLSAMSVIWEKEPSNERHRNDTPQTAEYISSLTSDGINTVEIRGVLAMPEPTDLGMLEEEETDDGSIPLARSIPLTSGARVRVQAIIGDGLHGSRGGQTGDFDFYRFGFLNPGQIVTIDITTDPEEPRLDTKIALYNQNGVRLKENDDGIFGEKDSYLEVEIPVADEYFVVVRGINSDWPVDPFDPASGPKVGSEGPYILTLGVDATDVDWFSMDLQAGDVVSASIDYEALRVTLADTQGERLMSSGLDRSTVLPDQSPLLRGGNANLAHVVPHAGRFAVAAVEGEGGYRLMLSVFRPGLQQGRRSQVLFVDFDGALYDAEALGGNSQAQLSPLTHFLELQHLEHQQDVIIDRALAVLEENLITDLLDGPNNMFELQILNSRDHVDPWGAPHVSRIIVGGSQEELGLTTVGIAESIDVGNFKLNETAIVLLDVLTDPTLDNSFASVDRAPHVSMADLLGLALGNVIAHEAGHLFASFHTEDEDGPVQLMEASPNAGAFIGVGPDGILGTADDHDVDLGKSPYKALEGYTGVQDTRSAVAFGLYGRQSVAIDARLEDGLEVGNFYPNPSFDEVWLSVESDYVTGLRLNVYDMLGRLVHTAHSRRGNHKIRIPVNSLHSGLYTARISDSRKYVIRDFAVVR